MSAQARSVALLGHANVGKSALFHQLTGQRVIVSNYPGTTVEVSRGVMRGRPELTALDTPGLVMLPSQTEDEQVTERVLFEEPLRSVVQVGDAKNLFRTLLLTTQLAEMGLPMLLALNMMDEAAQRGLRIDSEGLADRLGLPVIPTVAVTRHGLERLHRSLERLAPVKLHVRYSAPIEHALARLLPLLPVSPIAPRALGLLYLSGDSVAESWLAERLDPQGWIKLRAIRTEAEAAADRPLSTLIQLERAAFVRRGLGIASTAARAPQRGLAARLGDLAAHPIWGVAVLGVVLAALYGFVGVLGAQTLVGWLEGALFADVINPWVAGWVQWLAPSPWLAELVVGEYGLWTMGMTYALALILPIVTTFFLAFGLLEDSGYFARLAVLANRQFRRIGLNGRAVLPMVLGLGCVTMATLTTRTLESKRDRLLVTLLLALAVPCSAQLGVVLGMLGGLSVVALGIWTAVMLGVLLAVGWLANRLLPGERPGLLLELPPLRLPRPSNVLVKTIARLEWYLKEVIPLFLLGAALMFLLDQLRLLPGLIQLGQPVVVGWLGLPPQATQAFVLGFLRRDFGATGLFVMSTHGQLLPAQALVAMVTITLFVPCVASVFMIAKERGWRTALGMTALVIPLAFLIGGLLHRGLLLVGWGV